LTQKFSFSSILLKIADGRKKGQAIFSPVIQTVSKFKNLKKIDNNFLFKAIIEAKWHLRYSLIVKIMYLFPISKSGTLLRHGLIASNPKLRGNLK